MQSTITRRILYAFVVWVSGTISLPGVLAQASAQTITLNTPVTIQLDGKAPVDLLYMVDQAAWVTVTTHSLEAPGKIDTTVQVIGMDGRRVTGGFNDDHHPPREGFSERDAVIPDLYLPVPGIYTIRVHSFNGVDAGRVEVAVEPADIFRAVVVDEGDRQRITAALPANRVYRWTLPAADHDHLTITARDTSGTLDLRLMLRDPAGAVIAQNDDHASADLSLNIFDARIADFAVPAAGTYTIEVMDFAGSAGTFELTIAHHQ